MVAAVMAVVQQRTNKARTAYEQRASSVRTTRELRANYERELTRELRDAPVCRLPLKYTNNLPVKNRNYYTCATL